MNTSLSPTDLAAYVSRQMNYLFPDDHRVQLSDYRAVIDIALDRVHYCFKHSAVKHYCWAGETKFNHTFSDQYAVFIWFLANTLWQEQGPQLLLDKMFYLNKTLHAFECMYDTHLPDIFFLSHTVGTVLGKADYADFLVISQGCTVGVHHGHYPILDKGVALAANVSVIGKCQLGKCVSVGSNTSVFQRDLPDNTTAYTNAQGQFVVATATEPYAQKFFNVDLKTLL